MSRRGGPMTFYFDAASCSGCKACQVACMDRHALEVGTPWRRVSEVAGGGWERDGAAWRNTVFAYHLSISCNHCERPICLEGCPTRAITRRDDGVALIEPDRCMGCGYCGWVCPYSAPQYRADLGVMTKCSFCVEDLDAGGEPACVTACPVRALDAGERGRLAERHGTSNVVVDPTPLPARELTEPALLLAPHAEAGRSGEPGVDLTPRPPRGLREWALVTFTVLSQTAAGLTLFGGGLRWWLGRSGGTRDLDPAILLVVTGLLAAAICGSLLHLGRKRNAVRALSNLRSSWLSREILTAIVLVGVTALAWWPTVSVEAAALRAWAGWIAVPVAVLFLLGMARVYMQRTVPVWNNWRTPLAFTATAVLMGGLVANVVLWTLGSLSFEQTRTASLAILIVSVVGVGLPCGLRSIRRRTSRPGRVIGGAAGGLSVAAGLALLALLVFRPDPALGSVPAVLSWAALGLALIDQLARRRDYFARYERLGV
jgi:anaerobic dimethyl sulfoxide reductase subunit B (iron-sulfur subunit)